MNLFRRIAAALMVGIASLASVGAHAFTLTASPSPFTSGGSGELTLRGSLSNVYQLDISVATLGTLGGTATLFPLSDTLDMLSLGLGSNTLVASEVAPLSYAYTADPQTPYNITDDVIFRIPFTAIGNPNSVIQFVVTVCAIPAEGQCVQTGQTADPGVTPVSPESVSAFLRFRGNVVPEPGALALVAASLLAGAAVGSRRAARR